MNFVNMQKINEMISRMLIDSPDAKKIPQILWLKTFLYGLGFASLIIVLFIWNRIPSGDNLCFPPPFLRAIFPNVPGQLITVGMMMVCMLLHELLHAIIVVNNFKKVYITSDLPLFPLGVYCDFWVSKNHALLRIIFPFLIFIIIACVFLIITGNLRLFLWIIAINNLASVMDIYTFIIVFIFVPKNNKIFAGFHK